MALMQAELQELGIRWRRIVTVNVTIEIRSLVSEAPKTFSVSASITSVIPR